MWNKSAFEIYLRSDKYLLLSNILFSGIFQGLNYLSPLVVTAFLLKRVGVDHFGTISFALIIYTYLGLVCDYGTNISGSRKIALSRHNDFLLFEAFVNISILRFTITGIVTLLFLVFIYYVPMLNKERELFIWGLITLIGRSILPGWFWQGIEKMKIAAYYNFISQILYIVFVYLFIVKVTDYKYVFFWQGLSLFVAGCLCNFIIIKKYKFHLGKINIFLKSSFKENSQIFIMTLALNTYSTLWPLLLGIYSPPHVLGYYSAAERVVILVKQIIGATTIALLPYICKIRQESFLKVKQFFFSYYSIFILLILMVCSLLLYQADQVVILYLGSYKAEVVNILCALSFVVFISVLNQPIYLILLAYGYDQEYRRTAVWTTLICFILGLLFIPLMPLKGVLIGNYFGELLIGVFSLYFFLTKKKDLASISFLEKANI